jgi:predicted transcriptional regulator
MLQNLIDSNIELKVVEIAKLLDRDPSSISKKIKELKNKKK